MSRGYRPIVQAIITLSSYCSIFGLLFTLVPPTQIQSTFAWVVIVFATVAATYLVLNDVIEYNRSRPKRFSGDSDIARYMEKWLSARGRSIIVTRDMTWATGSSLEQLLRKKASMGELAICTQVVSPKLEELRATGAEIFDYSKIGYTPRSRFTIVGHGRVGSRVAVGYRDQNEHCVVEFEQNFEPTFSALEDISQLLIAASRSLNDVQERKK